MHKGEKMMNNSIRGTTVLALKKDNTLCMGCDGQVTLGDTVIKSKAVKLRKVYNDKILTGFAGSVADALTLFERLEQKLESYSGNIPRSVVELARDWRLDRALRRLEAVLVVGDPQHLYLISGNGEIIEPDDGIVGIGSGGSYALAAARALVRNTTLSAYDIVKQSLLISSEICIYSNSNIIIEEIKA